MTHSNLKTVGARRSVIDDLICIKSKTVCVHPWAKGLKGELSPVQWRKKGACTFFSQMRNQEVRGLLAIYLGRNWTSITLWELLRVSEIRSENLFFGLQLWRQEGCSNEQLFSTLVRLVIWLSPDVVSGELSHHLEKRQLSMSILGNRMSLLNTLELHL